MKKDYTHISIVLDRSGSMASLTNDVIGGFNKLMDEQALLPGEATATLVQFDTEYEVLYNGVKLKDAPDRTVKNYVPRGSTALYDAACRAIDETGRFLSGLAEDARPEKVAFIIITDGAENSSHEFTKADLVSRIKTQTEAFKWQFVYLSSHPDAFQDAASIGVLHQNTMSYTNDAAGNAQVYSVTSGALRSFRSGSEKTMAVNKSTRDGAGGSAAGS